MENLPSISVEVPVCCPLTLTVTPGRNSPSASDDTTPVAVNCCASAAKASAMLNNTVIILFITIFTI